MGCGIAASADGGFLQMRDGYFWDPATSDYFIPRGIAYQTWNPPVGANQSFAQLDYDLVEFKKMYANSVRCEFVWSQIEISPGVYDWSRTDHLVAKARELGFKLFVLIGFQYGPSWFPADWNAMNEDQDAVRSVVLNYEHPEARSAYSNFISQAASRYKDSDVIGAWILGNEYGYFDLWDPQRRFLGFDPISQSAFRSYLTELYHGNIQELNSVWATNYTDFNSAGMSRDYPPDRNDPGFQDLIQWRKQSIGNFVALGAIAARAADPNHLITYSMVGGLFGDGDRDYSCEDAKTIVTCCRNAGVPLDFWSINNYALATLTTELRSADFGIGKHRAESGLPVMVSETGHTSDETLFPDASPRQAKAVPGQMWGALISGAIGTHIFTWNDRDLFSGDFSREKGFGIVNQTRTLKTNDVYWNVLEMFRRMEGVHIERLVGGSTKPAPDMQFFWSKSTDMGWPRANHENIRLWSALKRLGYQPGIIDDEQFERGDYTNAPALVLSRCYQMDPDHLQKIATQVIPAGIHVHASADLPGQFDAYHRLNPDWAGLMKSVFGLDVSRAYSGWDDGVTNSFIPRDKRITFSGVGSLSPLFPGYGSSVGTWKIWHGIAADSGTTIITHTGMEGSQPPMPALQIKSHLTANAAINTFALGDCIALDPPATRAWDVRYDWLQAVYSNWFKIPAAITLSGPGARYVSPDYRFCRNGSVLISLLNEHTNHASVTVTSKKLLGGRTVENLTSGGILETDSDGAVSLSLEGDDFVLLYAYTSNADEDESLSNSSPQKLWFESAPTAIWPGGSGYPVSVGFDTDDQELNLFVSLELVRSRNTIYGKSVITTASGKGNTSVLVPVPDADLNDPNYVSSMSGASYVWHAWLEKNGAHLTDSFLPVRLVWGVRPQALPSSLTPGRTYSITGNWEELPGYEPDEFPTSLDRAELWESIHANAQHYNIVLELKSAGQVVASGSFVTSAATGNHVFPITVPRTAVAPFTWSARAEPATNVMTHDVSDSFEGRPLAAMTALLAESTNAISPLSPWQSYHYPTNGTQKWFDEGTQLWASDGSQSAFLIVTNPPPPLGYSGFGIRYVFDQKWSLPSDWTTWTNFRFSCDVQLKDPHRCVLELQVKNEDPGGTGKWIQFTQDYNPGPDGWQTIAASLREFVRPPGWPPFFDPTQISEIVVNIEMLDSNVVYQASFDNIRFDGPDTAISVGSPLAVYESSNDSAQLLVDSDGDGIPDLYETGTGIYVSPTDTGSDPDKADTDGDGVNDGDELLAGTNPNRADDVLAVQILRRAQEGGMVLSWPARAGRVYDVYFCDGNLAEAQFHPLENLTNLSLSADGLMEVEDSSPSPSNMRFYRIAVRVP